MIIELIILPQKHLILLLSAKMNKVLSDIALNRHEKEIREHNSGFSFHWPLTYEAAMTTNRRFDVSVENWISCMEYICKWDNSRYVSRVCRPMEKKFRVKSVKVFSHKWKDVAGGGINELYLMVIDDWASEWICRCCGVNNTRWVRLWT